VTGGVYWGTSYEPAGTVALLFSMFMSGLVTVYLAVTARGSHLASDEHRIEIPDGAGDIGFFSPFSYWPALISVGFGILILGPVFSYWLILIGGLFVAISVVGLLFQYEIPHRDDEAGEG
jgi:hypothetical protein